MKSRPYYRVNIQTGIRSPNQWRDEENTELIQLRLLNDWNRIAQLGPGTPRWFYYM